jgi:uridylate kinase
LKIVLRIGGSVLGSPLDLELLEEYKQVVSQLLKKHHKIAVVVGGGDVARQYIQSAKAMGLSHKEQDLVAIQASRLNARLVGLKFGAASVPSTVRGMLAQLERNGLAVMGGLRPGITTDTVAALIAGAWRSDILIKASDQEGIYTADPRLDTKARLLEHLSYEVLTKILGGEHTPGIHSIVDPVAVRHIAKRRLKLVVIDGRRPKRVLGAVKGEDVGSTVS